MTAKITESSIQIVLGFFLTVTLTIIAVVRPGEKTENVVQHGEKTENVVQHGQKTEIPSEAQKAIPVPLQVILTPSPPEFYPCSACHKNMPSNTKQRKLEQGHRDIILKHMPEGWCFTCHNPADRDKLHLADGRLIPFTDSMQLCAQCHGKMIKEWTHGLHGKRTGYWNGPKQYRHCLLCHSPHSPHFKPLAPLPPPMRPADIILKNE